MNKRDFIKTSVAGIIGMLGTPVLANSTRNSKVSRSPSFRLPPLPYEYDALEPFIDKDTLFLHHTHYHAQYTAGFNKAFAEAGIKRDYARRILSNASSLDHELVYNGGGFLNHKLFWKSLTPMGEGRPWGQLARAIDQSFGSFDRFKESFEITAGQIRDEGWVWLISQHDELKVVSTPNHHNPFMDFLPEEKRGFPIICLDLGKDAYFPLTNEKRDAYITGYWDFVNWKWASQRYAKFS